MLIKTKLSLAMITKNAEKVLHKTLQSVQGITDEIIIVDDFSSDKTAEIAKKYKAKFYRNHENDLGKQRAFSLKKAKGDWILVLDSDEYLSDKLRKEILKIKNQLSNISGYDIPFQTHFLGRPLRHGGENYRKLILFKRKKAYIEPALVHEKFKVKGKLATLKNNVLHYSYESVISTYKKFTDYAFREAGQKFLNKEKSSLKKIFIYPVHLFWDRFFKDEGYKDGIFRIPLDIGFAYMEWLTYLLLGIRNLKSRIKLLKI